MNKTGQQKNSIEELYIAASEFCRIVETAHERSKADFLSASQKILTLTYLKASLLDKLEEAGDENAEKFVQEEDWEYIQNTVSNKIGTSDRYIEVFAPESTEPYNTESEGLSDCFADVYQDLKDFVLNYEIGNQEAILAGLSNCLFSFENYWGPRLLAILTNLHTAIYSSEDVEEDEISEKSDKHQSLQDSRNWIINQRFNQ